MAMRKEPTMKLTNLIGVLALAGVVAIGCNSGPPITGIRPPSGTGGSNGGGGGTGGLGEGACTTDENVAVFDMLVYVTGKGQTEMGTDAASAIASDCLRGSTSSDPNVTGCGAQTSAVVACFNRCPAAEFDPLVDELVNCVELCQDETIMTATGGSSLSAECTGCYGATVACGAATCTSPQCVSEPQGEFCTACRCEMGCTPTFVVCSGIPTTDCD
jgi:hypothetical protein